MRIIAVCISVLILLASCASTQPGAGDSGAGSTVVTETVSRPAASETPAAPPQAPKRNSFLTKESVYFADGDAAGTLDEYTVYEWNPAFTTLLKETRYSASDALLEKIEYTYQGTNPVMKTTKVIVADERGREQEQVRTQVVYQYAQDRLQKETIKNNSGGTISSYEYAYDGQGHRASRVMKNGKDAVMTETAYTYANGRLVSAETKSAGGSTISSIAYQYDGQGNLVKQETRNASGKTTSVMTAIWQNGYEMKNELIGADNAPQQRETNEYSPLGDMVKKTIENVQGKSVQIIQYEYASPDGK
jgi:hypothetical protein